MLGIFPISTIIPMMLNMRGIVTWFITIVIALTVASCTFPEDRELLTRSPFRGIRQMDKITILTANLGNINLKCHRYLNNLCDKEVESNIAQSIRFLLPDVVSLQEVLSPWQCEEDPTGKKGLVCSEPQTEPQARRLLGDHYTIVCDSRNQFTCIGVRTDFATVEGCSIGAYCTNGRTGDILESCDTGFTVSAITVTTFNDLTFDVVNAHLQSTNTHCRTQMISQIFGRRPDSTKIINEDLVLLMGDFNLDPWRDHDHSAEYWRSFIDLGWQGKAFKYHNPFDGSDLPLPTSHVLFRRRTVDLVLSNFAVGKCKVMGTSEDTQRIDGGKGMDHKSLFGELEINPN
jgi:endonuclease/exonuclease/phosphatase family metal-dependent hydrolase